jgi:hypothetical protein
MRTLRAVTATVVIAGSLLALTDTAHAARRSGLAGSLLIEDSNDVYFFPQLMPQYRNMLQVDYGGNAATGNALLTLGNENLAWGFALHRGDILTPHLVNELAAVNGPASLFGPPEFTAAAPPATMVDFLIGANAWGLRVGLGRGAAFTGMDADTGESELFVMAEGGIGWGTRGQSTRIDLSGALTADFGSRQMAGDDVASGLHLGFSALLRGYAPIDSTLDLGFLGNVAVSRNSVTDKTDMMEPSDSTMAFTLGGGIGPAFRFGRAQVAAYGILRALVQGRDPNSEVDNDGTSGHDFVMPGMHFAAEIPLTDWLFVRTGAEYAFIVSGTSNEAGTSQTASNSGVFGWNAGLGAVVGDFRFDGSLQHGFVTGGPDFIGGTSPGLFMIAALTYSFDNARSGRLTVPEQEAAPALPERAPEPPPAAPEPAPAPAPEFEDPEAGAGGGVNVGGSIGGGAGFQTAPAPAAPPSPQPAAPAPVR